MYPWHLLNLHPEQFFVDARVSRWLHLIPWVVVFSKNCSQWMVWSYVQHFYNVLCEVLFITGPALSGSLSDVLLLNSSWNTRASCHLHLTPRLGVIVFSEHCSQHLETYSLYGPRYCDPETQELFPQWQMREKLSALCNLIDTTQHKVHHHGSGCPLGYCPWKLTV